MDKLLKKIEKEMLVTTERLEVVAKTEFNSINIDDMRKEAFICQGRLEVLNSIIRL